VKKATKKGERLCADISQIKMSSLENNKYWMLIKDEFSSMKWSFFINRKSESGKSWLISLRGKELII
jgi:hypothetical protein